jgi:hypothetical protein
LTYLRISGNANIDGSITGMALTYLRISGNTNIEGQIAGALIRLYFSGTSNNFTIDSDQIFGTISFGVYISGDDSGTDGVTDGLATVADYERLFIHAGNASWTGGDFEILNVNAGMNPGYSGDVKTAYDTMVTNPNPSTVSVPATWIDFP